MPRRVLFPLLFVVVLLTRLCHLNIVWTEEGYPLAAAREMLAGHWIYRDFWFDKPPLFPGAYLLWGAGTGWPLRIAGALAVTLSAWLAFRFARDLWGPREALWAAVLTAFSLTFWIPAAVMVLGPDLLMIAPHIAAVHAAWRGRALLSGLLCGVCLLLNAKAMFVILFCGWLLRPRLASFAGGAAVPCAVLLPVWKPCWLQVWSWGFAYSRDSFFEAPVREGILRTWNWMGFHAALVAGAALALREERLRWRWMLWMLVSIAAVAAGWRFFPRYYFQLLPVFALLAARGIVVSRWRVAVLLLLLIPAVRFAPRYGMLAYDMAAGRPHDWRDLAMEQDSERASEWLRLHAKPKDTLLVWGYRPEIFPLSKLGAGTPFLDSQPLTGVIADRHLRQAQATFPVLAAFNRALLSRTSPVFIVDGLGPYNPELAITRFDDLHAWLSNYHEVSRTTGTVTYERNAVLFAHDRQDPDHQQ